MPITKRVLHLTPGIELVISDRLNTIQPNVGVIVVYNKMTYFTAEIKLGLWYGSNPIFQQVVENNPCPKHHDYPNLVKYAWKIARLINKAVYNA